MANAHTAIERIEFILQEELTICNILYSSDEPGTPWGGGWKTKTFPKTKSAVDIMNKDAPNYILWNDGRDGVDISNA